MEEAEAKQGLSKPPEPDYDPPSSERTWYRNTRTGDRGFMCRRGGREMIRLDRPNDPTAIRPFSPMSWVVEKESRPLTSMQCAQIAFEADRALCRFFGDRAPASDWISAHESKRIKWMREGPKGGLRVRKKLYDAVRGALKGLEG